MRERSALLAPLLLLALAGGGGVDGSVQELATGASTTLPAGALPVALLLMAIGAGLVALAARGGGRTAALGALLLVTAMPWGATAADAAETLRVGVAPVGVTLQIKDGRATGPSVELWEDMSLRLGITTEYVVTDSIRDYFNEVFELYAETPQKPHEGIGIWVSGFFGSGKSSFAKNLGLALQNRTIAGEGAGVRLAQRIGDPKAQVLLTSIAEQIPTEAVIFDVSTDRGIRTGNQSITEIMYRLFLQSLGYARDLDLSELEITLEETGELAAFKAKYQEIFGKDWDV
jgi:hypothetical protein